MKRIQVLPFPSKCKNRGRNSISLLCVSFCVLIPRHLRAMHRLSLTCNPPHWSHYSFSLQGTVLTVSCLCDFEGSISFSHFGPYILKFKLSVFLMTQYYQNSCGSPAYVQGMWH